MIKKIAKKILILLLLIIPLTSLKAMADTNEEPIATSDGEGYVTYIGTNIKVTIPTTYERPDTSFRAVWVSSLTGDVSVFSNIDQYKREIMSMLDACDYYNINAIIFHIRMYNDALYNSKYCKWSKYYNTNPSWDALPWIIEECHRRGIEFHAWLNPYRVSKANSNLQEVSKGFQANNPASNPDNLLSGSDSIILNPGIPEVRQFLVNVCMEVIENYDVDAINFDDYFYINGCDDSYTRAIYNVNNLSLADFRREQVNLFIESLSKSMREYNLRTGRRVQLGIAPSGVWNSVGGSSYVNYDSQGNAITNGSSTTNAFNHYGNYLYADTLKWINNEWIDYILPQTYWAIEHPSGAYCDLCDWWDKVVKYKNVNFYSALALYQNSSTSGYSWYTNPLEGYNEIMYANKLENCRGTSVYTFANLKASITTHKSFERVKDLWSVPSILPEIRTMPRIIPNDISSLEIGISKSGYKLKFPVTENVKFYIIYRSEEEITYSPDEVIEIIGGSGHDGYLDFIDLDSNTNKNYNYAIRTQSNSLTLSNGKSFSTVGAKETGLSSLDKVSGILTSSNVYDGEEIEIRWDRVYTSYGNSINYELYYSYDNKNWTLNDRVINTNDGFGRLSQKLTINSDSENLYLKVYAYNNLSESMSDVKTIKINKCYGKINHFTCVGDYYSDQMVEFIWNNQSGYDDATYVLEVSTDNFDFSEVARIKAQTGVNSSYKMKLGEAAHYYFRLRGEAQGMVSYSKVIDVQVKNSFGEITGFKVDNSRPKKYYIGAEDDTFKIEFDRKESESYTINYVSRLSKDNMNYMLPSSFTVKNSFSTKNGKGYQTIYLTGTEYKYYYYLEVSMNGKVGYSDKIMFYCLPNEVFFDEFIYFMKQEHSYYIEETNMFN